MNIEEIAAQEAAKIAGTQWNALRHFMRNALSLPTYLELPWTEGEDPRERMQKTPEHIVPAAQTYFELGVAASTMQPLGSKDLQRLKLETMDALLALSQEMPWLGNPAHIREVVGAYKAMTGMETELPLYVKERNQGQRLLASVNSRRKQEDLQVGDGMLVDRIGTNPAAVLEFLKTGTYRAVLLEDRMPDAENAQMAVDGIRKHDSMIPIVVLTDGRTSKVKGATAYLQKGKEYSPLRLKKVMQECLLPRA